MHYDSEQLKFDVCSEHDPSMPSPCSQAHREVAGEKMQTSFRPPPAVLILLKGGAVIIIVGALFKPPRLSKRG